MFDYLDKLEQAGLISKVDEDGGTAVYTAETAYDLVEALYSIFDLGDDEPGPTTYTPDDFDEDEDDLLGEFADK